MSRTSKLLCAILIILPLIGIAYKTYVKNISFIPQTLSDKWIVHIRYNLERLFAESEQNEIYLPLISTNQYQSITDREFLGARTPEIFITTDGPMMLFDKSFGDQFSMQVELDLASSSLGSKKKHFTKDKIKKIKKEYTALNGIDSSIEERVRTLSKQITLKRDTPLEKVEKFKLFIKEELDHNNSINDLERVTTLLAGSQKSQAQLFELLARLNEIPARINFGYRMYTGKRESQFNTKAIYHPEVFIDGAWHRVDLFKEAKDRFFVFFDHRKVQQYHLPEFVSLTVSPVMINRVDSSNYLKKIKQVAPFFSKLSFHSFPLGTQMMFLTILLIPVGTLVLSFGRNIIGVNTFGIFTPILLTLFFLETSLLIGGIFFTLVVGIGFFQRYLLDKLYLLAVPRLSILLTVVIIAYSLFSLFLYHSSGSLPGLGSLNYFPIVIVTVFIERFSVNYIEEGPINTLKTLFGTLFISLLCYFVFNLHHLRLALFNHPEILFIIIGLNILIGSYKGYRLSELIRFKELRRIAQ